MDDEMFPPSEEGKVEESNDGGISLPEDEVPSEDNAKEEKSETSDKKESEGEAAKVEAPEAPKSEKKDEPKDEEKKEEDDEEFDLSDLLSEFSDNEESIKKSEDALANIENSDTPSKEDISVIKEENERLSASLKRMEDQLRKLSGDKSDLIFKNAELEAFGGESSDPQIIILSRNMEKAKSGDDRSKSKVLTILKDMLSELTGEDYDSKKTEKKVDILSAAEAYNSSANPNLKDKKDGQDENVLVM